MICRLVVIILCVISTSTTWNVCYSDELVQTLDANGNVVWTNAGPSQKEQQKRAESREQIELNSIANEILERHPEMHNNDQLIDVFTQTRDRFIEQGLSLANAMISAENEMVKNGTLVNQAALAEQRRLEEEERARQERISEYKQNETIQQDQFLRRVSLEKQLLEEKWQTALKNCANSKNSDCRSDTNKIYRNRIAKLESNPELYFYKQEKKNGIIQTQQNEEKRSGVITQQNEDKKGGVVFDQYGNVYNRTAGGIIDTKDGNFHPKAGDHGYINSQTGEFMPTH